MGKDRSNWKINFYDSPDEMRNEQVRAWQKKSGAERRAAAWDLVLDYWKNKGKTEDELRLQRAITSFKPAES